LFRIHVDVTLSNLNDQPDQTNCFLNQRDTWTMLSIGVFQLTQMKVSGSPKWSCRITTTTMRIMFFIFYQHSSKGPIKLDVSMFLWSDIFMILEKVWFSRRPTKKSRLGWIYLMKDLVWLIKILFVFNYVVLRGW